MFWLARVSFFCGLGECRYVWGFVWAGEIGVGRCEYLCVRVFCISNGIFSMYSDIFVCVHRLVDLSVCVCVCMFVCACLSSVYTRVFICMHAYECTRLHFACSCACVAVGLSSHG